MVTCNFDCILAPLSPQTACDSTGRPEWRDMLSGCEYDYYNQTYAPWQPLLRWSK